MNNNFKDDDYEDFISEVMNGGSSKNKRQKLRKKLLPKNSKKNYQKLSYRAKNTSKLAIEKSIEIKKAYKEKDQEDKKIIKIVFVSIIGVFVFIALFNLIGKLNNNVSPINNDIKETLSYEPYYPSSLPFGYKLHEDTVKQPEKDVLLYSLINERGSLIHISMQPIPEGLDQEKASSSFSEKREVDTPIGTATLGESPSGSTVANLLTKKSWIIITYNRASITDDDLKELIKSFEKV